MRTSQIFHRRRPAEGDRSRSGSIMVLAAGLLILTFAFAAFAVDIGYISLTRAQLQKSADAAALASVIEMYDGWGKGATLTPDEVEAAARVAAEETASANEAGGMKNVYLDPVRDVRLGQYQWNPGTQEWEKTWGVGPYNLVEVTLHRDQPGSANGDRPLDLFFAPLIGSKTASVQSVSTSALLPGVGLRTLQNVNVGVLPIALDVESWEALMAGVGSDDYTYNENTRTVTSGPDGILEVNLYPEGNATLPPGNRGTVDFGHNGNSTADLSRQILHGLNNSDLEAFGGEIRFDDLPMAINGDTGLSAGIKDELETIKGQPRLIPLFSEVSGPGNNAWYTIVKFVPIRVMNVQLTGKPSSKRVIIQPGPYVSATVISGQTVVTQDSIFAPAGLVQ